MSAHPIRSALAAVTALALFTTGTTVALLPGIQEWLSYRRELRTGSNKLLFEDQQTPDGLISQARFSRFQIGGLGSGHYRKDDPDVFGTVVASINPTRRMISIELDATRNWSGKLVASVDKEELADAASTTDNSGRDFTHFSMSVPCDPASTDIHHLSVEYVQNGIGSEDALITGDFSGCTPITGKNAPEVNPQQLRFMAGPSGAFSV